MSAWIKVEHDTPTKPQVRAIARTLDANTDEVVGMLIRFWTWADRETEAGLIRFADLAMVDDVAGKPGFGKALESVRWISETPDGLVIPQFDRHMGESAKSRALAAERQRKWREKQSA